MVVLFCPCFPGFFTEGSHKHVASSVGRGRTGEVWTAREKRVSGFTYVEEEEPCSEN
jgi:hypothetical protein